MRSTLWSAVVFSPSPASRQSACLPTVGLGSTPPIGAAYDVPVVVDESVFELANTAMACGADDAIIVMDGKALRCGYCG